MIGVIVVVFFGTLLVGIPIGVAVGATAISCVLLNPGMPVSTEYIFRSMVTALDSTTLLAVPLFILSGNLMAKGGISEKLFDFFAYFVGDKTGGLPIAAIVTCLFYGAISGSGPATVAAVGAMTIPILTRLGYDKRFVVGMVATAGGLGVIIPPSLPFIMYGVSSGESVSDLFLAGVIPGCLIALIMSLYTWIYCKKHGEDKAKLKANAQQLREKGLWKVFKEGFWALLTPVIILGGIYSGIVTPTEAATISVVYALIISLFVYKTMTFQTLVPITTASIRSCAPIQLIVAAAVCFGRILTMLQVPQTIANALTSTITSEIVLLLVINLFLLVVGMMMETLAAILILTPIFLPVITAIGMDPIHFGVMMVVNLAIGFITPPVGVNLYVASSLSETPVLSVARHALPYIAMFLLALLLITFIPSLSLVFVG